MKIVTTGAGMLCAMIIILAGCNNGGGNLGSTIADMFVINAVNANVQMDTNKNVCAGSFQGSAVNVCSDIEKQLIGSWHASPFVAAGFSERYVFFGDKSFIYYPDQYAENKSYYKVLGNWSVSENKLRLLCTSKVTYEGEREKVEEEEEISIGPMENEKPENSPYGRRIQIGEKYFWQYSDKTDIWEKDK